MSSFIYQPPTSPFGPFLTYSGIFRFSLSAIPPPPCPPCPPLPPPPPIPTVIPNPLPNSGFGDVDFGQDFDFLNDLDPRLDLVGGLANLGQALVHRLSTPRGGLFYDLNYGLDVRAYLNDTMTPARTSKLNNEVSVELLKDERVDSASCSAVFDASARTLTLTINIVTSAGPFTLIAAVTAITVTLLSLNPAAP